MCRLEPSEEQLRPFNLTQEQFRLLSLIAAGADVTNGAVHTEACLQLQRRGFVGEPGQITPQGQAFLRSIHELLE
jgi:hypothetical protein